MENQLLIALSKNKLLKNIDISKIDLKNVKGNLITISEGEILYREGDAANTIYLVVSGEINILKKRLLGKTKSYIFEECDFFGHEEFLEGTSRFSTAVALHDSYLILLTREEVDILIAQESNIQVNLKEPVAEIDEEQLSKKNKIVNKIENKEIPALEPVQELNSITFDEPADKMTHKSSKEFFQSISDVSRADANPVQPLKKFTTVENELPANDDFAFYEAESLSSKENVEIKPDLLEETKNPSEQLPIQNFFPRDISLDNKKEEFDESAFLNEDGIPKADVELPSFDQNLQYNSENDLDDALFKILNHDEIPSFEPEKEESGKEEPEKEETGKEENEFLLIQDSDERFIPTNKIKAEPVMDFESFASE